MLRALIMLCLALFLVGCSKLTMENYNKLKVGMKYDEVTSLIGSPDSCDEQLGTRRCLWGKEDGQHIKVNFINEAAVLYSHKGLK